jgi:hypothetical protein
MSLASLAGSWYYATFIDDFSHKDWIYCLKIKDEVFNKFTEFKTLVEIRQEGRSK